MKRRVCLKFFVNDCRFDSLADISDNVTKFSKHYFMWLLLRKQNAFDQAILNNFGWALQNRTCFKEKLEKTIEAYLLSINAKIT